MPTNDKATPRPLPVTLSCGCVIYFTCKPRYGDHLICVFHNSPVRVIRTATAKTEDVA